MGRRGIEEIGKSLVAGELVNRTVPIHIVKLRCCASISLDFSPGLNVTT